MGSLERILFNAHPHATYVALSGVLSMFSLSATPGMVPIVLTLTTLLIYSRKLFPTYAQHTVRHTTALWASLTLGGSIPKFSASLHALSKPVPSIMSLLFLSGLTSLLSIGGLYLETKASSRFGAGSVRFFLFPAIWSTLWCTIAYLSPLGTLSTWSPVEGTSAYDWLVPLLGSESLNWIAAAWAVVISQTIMSSYMGDKSDDDELPGPLISTDFHMNGHFHENTASGTRQYSTTQTKTAILAAALVLLTVPSYMLNSLPLPVGDVGKVTPLVVGCALPTFDEYKHHEPTFDDFLKESMRLANRANFILWPEGAVRFMSEQDRDDKLAQVRAQVNHAFVGVAFEEILSDLNDPTGRKAIRRTGIAVVSSKSTTPHHLYYKQHLVPIAESFSLSHSREPPTTFMAKVKVPFRAHDYERQIPVTAAICLDFSAPSLFEGLDVKPGLILAPARTWDVTVGHTMWKQASQRAREVGSTVLWCDGGAGGVSGISSHGRDELVQVGSGSWTHTIGLEYPFKGQQTFYARYGGSALLLFWALVVGSPVYLGGSFVVERLRRRSFNSGPSSTANLLDD